MKNLIAIRCGTCRKIFKDYRCNHRRFCSPRCGYRHLKKKGSKHGESRTRLYQVWLDMKQRCRKNKYYQGLTVCREWKDSFESFRDWARRSGYKSHLEIDRKDNKKGYSPENCRWATRVEQMRNTRKRCNAKTSRFRGVSRHKTPNGSFSKWRVQLHENSKPIHIGMFDSEAEAARAYDAAAKQRYGEFASLNFP